MNMYLVSTVVLTLALVAVIVYFNWKINQIKSRMRKQINKNIITLVSELKENKEILEADSEDSSSKEKLSDIVTKALDVGEDSGSCEQSVEELCEVAWDSVTYERENAVPPYANQQLCNRDKKASRCDVY